MSSRIAELAKIIFHGSQAMQGLVAELRALPEDAWERELFPLLLVHGVPVDREPSPIDCVDELQSICDEWERRMRQPSEEVDIEKRVESAMRELLAGTYEARFDVMPVELRAVLDTTTDVAMLRQWVALFATASNDQIAADILASARP